MDNAWSLHMVGLHMVGLKCALNCHVFLHSDPPIFQFDPICNIYLYLNCTALCCTFLRLSVSLTHSVSAWNIAFDIGPGRSTMNYHAFVHKFPHMSLWFFVFLEMLKLFDIFHDLLRKKTLKYGQSHVYIIISRTWNMHILC